MKRVLASVGVYVGLGFMTAAHAGTPTQTEIAQLLANDGEVREQFGYSVSVDGDTVLIGANADDDNGAHSGSAYVFTRSGNVWTQEAKLLPSDGAAFDRFGSSVSVDGDTAVIGASSADTNGTNSGSAYVFTRSGESWTQQVQLQPTDSRSGSRFGSSVSIGGDTVVVGAEGHIANGNSSGSAYVFTRSGGAWTQQAQLLPSDGMGGDDFGFSISVDGDTVLIGAYLDDDNGDRSGSAYVFTRSGNVWAQEAKLLPSDGAAFDRFGFSVSVDGDTAVVGALWDDDNGSASGSAYVFVRSEGSWSQKTKLLADDGTPDDSFGSSVSLDGDTAVIGARLDSDIGQVAGSAYVFTRSGEEWTQQVKLLASDGEAEDLFGYSVSVDGATVVVGMWVVDKSIDDPGSAYVFQIEPPFSCVVDFAEPFGILDLADISAFVTAFINQQPSADLSPDGMFDLADISQFVSLFTAGCP